MHIAFIGLGKMGLPMALHLQKAGCRVVGCDAVEAARQRAIAAGLRAVPTVQYAAEGADIVVSSLPDDTTLLDVAAQLAAAPRPVPAWVDTSTVSLAASAQADRLVSNAGIAHLRATVSGNAAMAQAAQLTVMASGPKALYERVETLLALWGQRRFWLGEADEARLMKLVVNLMIAQTTAMLAEALTLGRKGGLKWADLWQVITESAVASPIVKAKSVPLARRDFSPSFTVQQMQKDLGLVLDAGQSLGVPLPLTEQALMQQQAAQAAGMGDDDYAAVIRLAERAASLGEPV